MHPVERKLRNEICPYLAMADVLPRSGRYMFYAAYSYVGELAAGLGGFGIAPSVLGLVGGTDADVSKAYASALASPLGWAGAALLIGWLIVKVHIKRSQLDEHYTLMLSSRERLRTLLGDTKDALRSRDPLPLLVDVQSGILSIENLCVIKGIWPVGPPTDKAREASERLADDLVRRFSTGWDGAPSSQQQGGRS